MSIKAIADKINSLSGVRFVCVDDGVARERGFDLIIVDDDTHHIAAQYSSGLVLVNHRLVPRNLPEPLTIRIEALHRTIEEALEFDNVRSVYLLDFLSQPDFASLKSLGVDFEHKCGVLLDSFDELPRKDNEPRDNHALCDYFRAALGVPKERIAYLSSTGAGAGTGAAARFGDHQYFLKFTANGKSDPNVTLWWRQDVVETLAPKVDYIVLVALEEEFKSIRAVFDSSPFATKGGFADTSCLIYTITQQRSRKKATCGIYRMAAMTPVEAAIHTVTAIRQFSPKIVVSLGIAGGVNNDVGLGDVVVATEVTDYLAEAKVVDEILPNERRIFDIKIAGHSLHATFDLHRRAVTLPSETLDKWRSNGILRLKRVLSDLRKTNGAIGKDELIKDQLIHDDLSPKLLSGPVGSSSVLMSSYALRDWLLHKQRKFLAVEMECFGMLRGVESFEDGKPRTLIIKGISDMADPRKEKLDNISGGKFRKLATQNAAELLLFIIHDEALGSI